MKITKASTAAVVTLAACTLMLSGCNNDDQQTQSGSGSAQATTDTAPTSFDHTDGGGTEMGPTDSSSSKPSAGTGQTTAELPDGTTLVVDKKENDVAVGLWKEFVAAGMDGQKLTVSDGGTCWPGYEKDHDPVKLNFYCGEAVTSEMNYTDDTTYFLVIPMVGTKQGNQTIGTITPEAKQQGYQPEVQTMTQMEGWHNMFTNPDGEEPPYQWVSHN